MESIFNELTCFRKQKLKKTLISKAKITNFLLTLDSLFEGKIV